MPAKSPSNANVVTTREVRTRSCQVQDALRVEVLISPPERYPANVRICSQPVSKGKTGEGFRVRLIVVPNIPELVAVLHIAAPDDVKNSWICTNLMVTISVCKAKDLDFKISRSRVEKVCKDRPVTGWVDMCPLQGWNGTWECDKPHTAICSRCLLVRNRCLTTILGLEVAFQV